MQTATKLPDDNVLPDHPLRDRVDMVRRVGVFNSRADATARAALVICGFDTAYALNGRGPSRYDDFGLVLASLQAAWDMGRIDAGGYVPGDALPDFGTLQPVACTRTLARHAGTWLAQLGLVDVGVRPGEILAAAQPGDVLTFNGHFSVAVCVEGPRLRGRGEPVDTRCNDAYPLLAIVFPDQKPRTTRGLFMSTAPATLHRWPAQDVGR